jgi:hypothetical protein
MRENDEFPSVINNSSGDDQVEFLPIINTSRDDQELEFPFLLNNSTQAFNQGFSPVR